MKISILYICIGPYSLFWNDFYISCEKYFIPDIQKEYFVYTDSNNLVFNSHNNVNIIYQKNLGWPDNTLMRYDIFLKNYKAWNKNDFAFFFNANIIFIKKIRKEEFIPDKNKDYVACIHPGFFNKEAHKFCYEKRRKSKAFIKNGQYYLQGAINGGRTNKIMAAMKEMNENIKLDKENGIIAIWHDESHWNKFINNNINKTKILPPSYLYPEGWSLPFSPNIITRDKNKYGGHHKLRETNESNYQKIRRIIVNCKLYVNNKIKRWFR